MSSFNYFKKGACPVCSGESKGCRESKTSGLLFCRSRLDVGHNGWGWVGDDRNGFGIYADKSSDRKHDSDYWAKIQEERQKKISGLLPNGDRDRHYRAIARNIGIDSQCRAELLRRGLSESQIAFAHEQGMISAWRHGVGHNLALNTSIAGVNPKTGLTTGWDGLAIYAIDVNGNSVGAQVLPWAKKARELGKYQWISSTSKGGNPSTLKSGERPLFVRKHPAFDPNKECTVELTEGALKSLVRALKVWENDTQVVVIGNGGTAWNYPENGDRQLLEILAHLSPSRITVQADAGAQGNRFLRAAYSNAFLAFPPGVDAAIGWWGQTDKEQHPDIDELSTQQIERISLEDWLKKSAVEVDSVGKPGDRQVSREEWEHQKRLGWLANLIQRIKPLSALNSAKAFSQKIANQETTAMIYAQGEMGNVWAAAAKQYKVILDRSNTGSGKSYTSGTMLPVDFEGKQLFYLSSQHRNVTTETLQEWTDLEARHNGLVKETQQDGSLRLRRKKKGEAVSVQPNCNRTGLIDALRNQNVNGADTSGLICATCPLYEKCSRGEGDGYGYINQRRKNLGKNRVRMHPDSAPNPKDFDFSASAAIWDEFGAEFRSNREIHVSGQDITDMMNFIIRSSGVKFYSQLEALFDALAKLIDPMNEEEKKVQKTKLGKYGLDHFQVLETLPVPDIDPEALSTAIAPDLSFLNHTLKYGEDLADLPASVRAQFAENDRASAAEVNSKIIKQWTIELVSVLKGEIPGAALNLSYDGLTISIPDIRHRELAKSFGTLIITDATLTVKEAAKALGMDESEIFECKQEESKGAELKILQVTNLGKCSRQRRKNQQAMIDIVVNHCKAQEQKTAVIDFKEMNTTGAWWVDSRGSNAMQDCNQLILVGTPFRNLAAMKAEYAAIVGVYPQSDDKGFTEYFHAKVNADIIQGIGRLRANRRAGEQLTCVIISDFEIQGIEAQKVKASEITPEAMTKSERFFHLALQAKEALLEAGQEITQSSLARLMGYSQQYLSKRWEELQLLLKEVSISVCCSHESDSLLANRNSEHSTTETGCIDDFIANLGCLGSLFDEEDLTCSCSFSCTQVSDGQI